MIRALSQTRPQGLLRLISPRCRTQVPVRNKASTSHSHGHGHGEHAPTMFNEKPGRKREAWEWMYYILMGGGSLVTFVALCYKPDTRIRSWARDEAEVRQKLAEEGEELELGKNYAHERYGHNWVREEVGIKPSRVDSD